ncbi:fetuin-B-like [Spea bombifrons]|uniref:fetuin-B-like n=1 Tax=Spea bombifrons TaxID=233779 RepID=UPI00234980D6|nr:fetuin-B-like [Spea bombifrons]
MGKDCILILFALISLCSARSPPFPNIIPVDCNATEFEAGVALDLINDARDEGFVLKPFRVVDAFRQESQKLGGGSIFYLTVDVLETDCSVLSGVTWKNCSSEVPFHETVFGRCKAVIYISKPWRILKLYNYNCTMTPVPSRLVHSMCPDCPSIIRDITPDIKTKADRMVEIYNKNNNTNHFKVDHIERVRSQWVFGRSYFLKFTIKETECLKTQSNVTLSNCSFLGDPDVGFCTGNVYTQPTVGEVFNVNCEIYGPQDDDDHHHHHHRHHPHHHHHGRGRGECPNDEESPNQPQDGHETADAPTQNNDKPETPGHSHRHDCRRCRSNRGHTHGCRQHHHHGHPPHHHHHHHHRHHHPDHHHQPDNHNQTSKRHSSSSEEHTEKKHVIRKPKGSVELIYLNEGEVLPTPTIDHQVPPQTHFHDVIDFPKAKSPLETCPGQTKQSIPQILNFFPNEK